MVDRFFHKLDAGLATVHKIFVFIASVMLISLIFMMDFDLTARFLYAPVPGMSELTEIFLLYMTFLGTAWLFREDGHVIVDIVLANLIPRAKRVFAYVNYLLIAVTALVLTCFGFLTTWDNFQRGVSNPTILETPIAIIIVIIPIGALVLLLEVMIKAWKLYRGAEV